MTTLDTPLTRAAGIGARAAKILENAFGMATVRDLVYHFPRRYAERGELTDIASLRLGDDVTILAQVLRCNMHPMRSRPGSIVDGGRGEGSGKTLSAPVFTSKEGQAK